MTTTIAGQADGSAAQEQPSYLSEELDLMQNLAAAVGLDRPYQ